jgi:hypothetical protein
MLVASDASNGQQFHRMPDHIKKILYLDAPDIILELNGEPILTVEYSKEAGTGHNTFQRFARIAASVENGVPALYIYPEAKVVRRRAVAPKWDCLNYNVLRVMERLMRLYEVPALFFYYPSLFNPSLPRNENIPPDSGLVNDAEFPSSPNSPIRRCHIFFLSLTL